MRPLIVPLLFGAALLNGGCAGHKPHPAPAEKMFVWLGSDLRKFIENLGYSGSYVTVVERSSAGDRLFLQFKDKSGTNRLAVVSSEETILRELAGPACLDDQGHPVMWVGPRDKQLHIDTGISPPAGVQSLSLICAPPFVLLFDINSCWVADYRHPARKLVVVPRDQTVQLLALSGARLHLFTRGPPERQPRKDRWFILKHYQYEVTGQECLLRKIEDLYYTWQVFDFDAETGMLAVRSWQDMFAHTILVDTSSGRQSNIGKVGANGLFLKSGVVEEYRRTAEKSRQ